MKHSFETSLAENTQMVLQGKTLTRNGQGGANVLGTVRHQFSRHLWVEVGSSLLSPYVASVKGTYTHDENT